MNSLGRGWLERVALRSCDWAERWFPDAYVFASLGVVLVALIAMAMGSTPIETATAFGGGFWNLIPFTFQVSFTIVSGYAVATSQPVARIIDRIARVPSSGRAAVCMVAAVSMLLSFVHWALSEIVGSLLVRSLAKREGLRMDYRAAGAAAYMGLGSVWALGLSSSAAQLQANPASMPASLLKITGVIPFQETIFTWQSILMMAAIFAVTIIVAWLSTPRMATNDGFNPNSEFVDAKEPVRALRPGERLEHSPALTLLLAALGVAWLLQEFAAKGFIAAISNLNTYNFLFFVLGLLLHWRPRRFLNAAARGIHSITGVFIQFPLYAGIAAMITATPAGGMSLADHLAAFFTRVATQDTFPIVMGIYSAVLGFFVPSGGGKWVIEAPYVMQAANDLHVHLGWTVQIYNAAEALPNLINPFWMLPILGILGLRARDLIGYTFVQFVVHVPLVLLLLWSLGKTLGYHAPVMP